MYTNRDGVIKLLVGNKIDKANREVTRAEGIEFARSRGMVSKTPNRDRTPSIRNPQVIRSIRDFLPIFPSPPDVSCFLRTLSRSSLSSAAQKQRLASCRHSKSWSRRSSTPHSLHSLKALGSTSLRGAAPLRAHAAADHDPGDCRCAMQSYKHC